MSPLDPLDERPDAVPNHLIDTYVEVTYVDDGIDRTVTGLLQRADGGFVVIDGHAVIPILQASLVKAHAASPPKDTGGPDE